MKVRRPEASNTLAGRPAGPSRPCDRIYPTNGFGRQGGIRGPRLGMASADLSALRPDGSGRTRQAQQAGA